VTTYRITVEFVVDADSEDEAITLVRAQLDRDDEHGFAEAEARLEWWPLPSRAVRDCPHDPGRVMADDAPYNGHANYPTWAVSLWLSNTESLYYEACDLACATSNNLAAAETLKDFVLDLVPDLGASFSADLLGNALDRVDWRSIASDFGDEEIGAEEVGREDARAELRAVTQ